jgi:hypothetical protein
MYTWMARIAPSLIVDGFYGPVFRPHGRPTARFVGWCLGGVTFALHLPGQFLRSVSEERAVGLEKGTDRTQKSIFACGRWKKKFM